MFWIFGFSQGYCLSSCLIPRSSDAQSLQQSNFNFILWFLILFTLQCGPATVGLLGTCSVAQNQDPGLGWGDCCRWPRDRWPDSADDSHWVQGIYSVHHRPSTQHYHGLWQVQPLPLCRSTVYVLIRFPEQSLMWSHLSCLIFGSLGNLLECALSYFSLLVVLMPVIVLRQALQLPSLFATELLWDTAMADSIHACVSRESSDGCVCLLLGSWCSTWATSLSLVIQANSLPAKGTSTWWHVMQALSHKVRNPLPLLVSCTPSGQYCSRRWTPSLMLGQKRVIFLALQSTDYWACHSIGVQVFSSLGQPVIRGKWLLCYVIK